MTDSIQPAAAATETRRQRWRRGVRWFAAEFLVVVAGILVALALQSWYASRQDAKVERLYLAQLDGDLGMNERILSEAITGDSIRLVGNARLITALYTSGPLSRDTALQWLRWNLAYFSDPRPILGTVNTLLETGHIALIRDQLLRSKIVAYASLMTSDQEELRRSVVRLSQATDAERTQWERKGIRGFVPSQTAFGSAPASSYSDAEVAGFVSQYLAAWPVMQADPDLRAAYQMRRAGFANRIYYLRRMLTATTELRAVLGASTRSKGAGLT